jgi:hypothetical protein
MVGASDFFKWAGARREVKGTSARTNISMVGASDFFKWAGASREMKGDSKLQIPPSLFPLIITSI